MNRNGHVIELTETGNDAAATAFTREIFMLCGEPSDPSPYFAGFDKSRVSPISSPGDGGTLAQPTSRWPDGGANPARPSVVVVTKTGGDPRIGL